jgi:hypothetical protein
VRFALVVLSVYHRAFECRRRLQLSHHPHLHQSKDSIICLFIRSPDPRFSRYMILNVLLPPYSLLYPMTISSSIKTEVRSSIYSMALYLVAQQPHQYSICPNMADPSSSPPTRTKPEPMDSLSPSTSIELRRRSKTGCLFADCKRVRDVADFLPGKTCRRRKKKCDEARPGCKSLLSYSIHPRMDPEASSWCVQRLLHLASRSSLTL